MAFDLQVAALTIYAEASGASHEERSAVAHVIVNRLKAGRWGKTIAAVCLRRMQFSEWNGDAADNTNLLRAAEADEKDPVMADCLASIGAAKGGWPDPTDNATHYHDRSIAPPAWATGARVTLQTDKFIFYAGVK